jgi:hypothetical protein
MHGDHHGHPVIITDIGDHHGHPTTGGPGE